MAVGVSYEAVIEAAGDLYSEEKGTWREYKILERLGLSHGHEEGVPVGDFVQLRAGILAPTFFRTFAFGRRALMTVPSLNIPDGLHMLYWNGREVMDPCRRKVYERFHDLLPSEMILFRETP